MIKACDLEFDKVYYSPKGIPCKLVEVQESQVVLESQVTKSTVIVPREFPLVEVYDMVNEDMSAVVLPKEEKQEVATKAKKVRTKTSLNGLLYEIMSGVAVGETININVVLESVHGHVSTEFTDMPDEKILHNLKVNTLYKLKKLGVTFTSNRGSNSWKRN